MSKLFKFLFASCLLLTAYCSLTTAQTDAATLSGTVQDEKNDVVPGANVTIANIGSGARRNVMTNEEGYFVVPLLPPATYTVTVERDGFATVLVQDLILNVADNRSIVVQLQIKGAVAEVRVDADTIAVNTSGDGMSTLIDRDFVARLPNNGNSFSTLALLTPGVTVSPTANGEIGQFSVNGQRASANVFTVDGVSANIGAGPPGSRGSSVDLSLAGAYPGSSALGGTNNLVSQDALQEFKIQTSGYGAEAGRQPGGQVNVASRSGTNDYRGGVFHYIRNEALDARSYFNKEPANQTPLRLNQFGGSFGGPLPFLNFGEGGPIFSMGKDRTFFFFSYEGQRLLLPESGTAFVPSLRLRGLANAVFRPILDAYPQPSGPETTTTTACVQPQPPTPPDPTCAPNGFRYSGRTPFDFTFSNPSTLDALSVRIDHRVNSSHTVFWPIQRITVEHGDRPILKNQKYC